ncbi:MAG: hypothetical protein ACT4OM_02800 [Actinomycetota bacterium]
MSEQIDSQMRQKLAAAKAALGAATVPVGEQSPVQKGPEELREILKKFRKVAGANGNPGTLAAQDALRAGWVIASGRVEGFGEEVFHVLMLTNGALFYTSGELTAPLEFTGKWILGDSIDELEALIPDTVARIMAENDLDWPEAPQY